MSDEKVEKPSRLKSAAAVLGLAPIAGGMKAAQYGAEFTKGKVSPETQKKLWGNSEKAGEAAGRAIKGYAKHAIGMTDSPEEGMKKGGVVKGSSASRRADGIAQRGKTKGRMI